MARCIMASGFSIRWYYLSCTAAWTAFAYQHHHCTFPSAFACARLLTGIVVRLMCVDVWAFLGSQNDMAERARIPPRRRARGRALRRPSTSTTALVLVPCVHARMYFWYAMRVYQTPLPVLTHTSVLCGVLHRARRQPPHAYDRAFTFMFRNYAPFTLCASNAAFILLL